MSNFNGVRLGRAAVVAAATVALVAGMMVGAGSALGKPKGSALACGTTITASVTLTQDMNCTGDAIIIGAAGVTVDLNNHKISGPAGTGIVDVGYNDVTVENGTIADFTTGVGLENLTGAVVQDLTITIIPPVFGSTGILLQNTSDTTVSRNHLPDPSVGGGDVNGHGNTWSDNTITEFGHSFPLNSFAGIVVQESVGDLIDGNRISGGAAGLPVGDGIFIEQSIGTTVTHNDLRNLDTGISLGNDVFGGFNTGTLVRDNNGLNNGQGLETGSGTDEAYISNTFSSNDTNGMEIDFPHHAVLTNNITSNNTASYPVDGYGIFVKGGSGNSATLNGNTANHNNAGLYSQFPTAGSGNHASGNTNVNCFNVTC